jgi:hypothetical protein
MALGNLNGNFFPIDWLRDSSERALVDAMETDIPEGSAL